MERLSSSGRRVSPQYTRICRAATEANQIDSCLMCVGHLKFLDDQDSQRRAPPIPVCTVPFSAEVLLTSARSGHILDCGGRCNRCLQGNVSTHSGRDPAATNRKRPTLVECGSPLLSVPGCPSLRQLSVGPQADEGLERGLQQPSGYLHDRWYRKLKLAKGALFP